MKVKMMNTTMKTTKKMMVMNRLFGSGLMFGMSWIWIVTGLFFCILDLPFKLNRID